jgi:uncharacterized protein
MTASAHVLVFRPLIEIMRARGDEVEITAREYAQTLQLLELHGLEAEVIGRHGGRSRFAKARAMAGRLRALRRWARGRRFDVALAHGSHELTMTARRLGVPSSTTFDYEWAYLKHKLGCRAATKVVVPEAIPPERLRPHSNPLFPQTLEFLGRRDDVHAVVIPRTEEQREYVRRLALPSVILPERAVDAQSLIALSDVVVSAGGTMNREAAALGVPVYTTYGGRLGGVDEMPIREGRLVPLTDPRALELNKRERDAERVRREPGALLDLLLAAA